jgi:glycosyltransferase involved in cell wall biosynthesis
VKILVTTFSFPDPAIDSYDGRFVLSEVLGYAQNGASVVVLTPHYPGARREERLEPGIQVRRFRYFLPERWQRLKVPGQPIYRTDSALALLQVPLVLMAFAWNILRHAGAVDLIHAQWTITGLLALPAKWVFGTKLVITARGSDLRLLPGWLNRWLHRRVDAAIDCFGPQPWNVAYKKAYPARYLRLPLSVDTGNPRDRAPELEAAAREAGSPLIVLYIGRFDQIKLKHNRLPLIDLIAAAGILKSQGVPVRVFYLGDGERQIERRMREAIFAHGVNDEVTLLGPRVQVAPYARTCHLGIGGIALNGVAHDFTVNGKPQILMTTPENEQTPWRDGVNALLVPPDDPVALAERIAWAATHRDEIRRLGEDAKKRFKDLMTDTHEAGRLYLAAFQSLLEE